MSSCEYCEAPEECALNGCMVPWCWKGIKQGDSAWSLKQRRWQTSAKLTRKRAVDIALFAGSPPGKLKPLCTLSASGNLWCGTLPHSVIGNTIEKIAGSSLEVYSIDHLRDNAMLILRSLLSHGTLVALACLCLPADAQTQHDTQHVAIETAINNVLPCAKIDLKRMQRYVVTGADIEGMSWQAICVEVVGGDVLVSWSIPTAREDGTLLAVSEIAGYTITYLRDDGVAQVLKINDGAATSHLFTDLRRGVYVFQIAATDTGGLQSDLSNSVTYRL